MTAHIMWQPPEGCDVLAPTVGGGRAPAAWMDKAGAWRPSTGWLGLESNARTLLLQHAGQPARAGMDAAARALLSALGIDADGASVRATIHNGEAMLYLAHYRAGERGPQVLSVYGVASAEGLLPVFARVPAFLSPPDLAPEAVAPWAVAAALAHHVGGRAIITGGEGREIDPKGGE